MSEQANNTERVVQGFISRLYSEGGTILPGVQNSLLLELLRHVASRVGEKHGCSLGYLYSGMAGKLGDIRAALAVVHHTFESRLTASLTQSGQCDVAAAAIDNANACLGEPMDASIMQSLKAFVRQTLDMAIKQTPSLGRQAIQQAMRLSMDQILAFEERVRVEQGHVMGCAVERPQRPAA